MKNWIYKYIALIGLIIIYVPMTFGGRGVLAATPPGVYMDEITHPVSSDLKNAMLNYSERSVFRETSEQKRAEIADYVNMTKEQFVNEVTANLPAKISVRSGMEIDIFRMAQIYTTEEDTTKKADLGYKVYDALVKFALNDDVIAPNITDSDFVNECNTHNPIYLVMAYDYIYNLDVSAFDTSYGIDTREKIEQWFYNTAERVYNHFTKRTAGNLVGYTVKHMAGIGVVLNNPEVIRWAIYISDKAFTPFQFYGDGMWWEGSISYCTQLYANIKEAFPLINSFTDPADYVDNILGIKLNKTDISARWPIVNYSATQMAKLIHPDGTRIASNDTHPSYSSVVGQNLAIDEKNLGNIEFNHFGFFGLKNGDTQDAQNVTLKLSAVTAGIPFGGGHYHGDSLSMSLWAGHQELLPDAGYPSAVNNYRYLHMSPVTHNNSWIWDSEHSYSSYNYNYARPKLLRYDDGTESDGTIQLVEAEQLFDETLNIEDKRRILILVKTSDNTSYTFDLQTLQGGDVHENFLRASEDEASILTFGGTPIANDDSLREYLAENTKTGLMLSQASYNYNYYKTDMFTDAAVYSGSESVAFKWSGEESGAVLSAFVKGVEDSEFAFSQMPTLRRTGGDVSKKDDFPNYHFYQRREVSEDEKTRFSAVYEGISQGASAKVANVSWQETADAVFAVIDLGEVEDVICVSDTRAVKIYDGLTFTSEIGWVRRNKADKSIINGYIYGGGKICTDNAVISCQEDFTANITDAARVPYSAEFNKNNQITSEKNTLTLDKDIPDDLAGRWGVISFPDGSGISHRIESIDGKVLELHNDLGFNFDGSRTEFATYPARHNANNSYALTNAPYANLSNREIEGELTFLAERSYFGEAKSVCIDVMNGDSRAESVNVGETYYIESHTANIPHFVFVGIYCGSSDNDMVLCDVVSAESNDGEGRTDEFTISEEFLNKYQGTQNAKIWIKCMIWDSVLRPLCDTYVLE